MTIWAGVWMVWGASFAGDVQASYFIAAAVIEIALLGFAIATISRGRKLARACPPSSSDDKPSNRAFSIVSIAEFSAILIGCLLVAFFKHPEYAPVWVAFVVGVHFVPLAHIFRAPIYRITGAAMVLWSIACVMFFRGNVMAASVAIGSGVVLWTTSTYALGTIAIPRLRSG